MGECLRRQEWAARYKLTISALSRQGGDGFYLIGGVFTEERERERERVISIKHCQFVCIKVKGGNLCPTTDPVARKSRKIVISGPSVS